MTKIQELIKKAEDKVNSTMLSKIRKTEINLILLEIQKEAINYKRCSTEFFCSMSGKGFCPYEEENGKCTMKEPCKNHTTK